MRGRTAEELLRLPVRLHGIQLGRPSDVLVDLRAERVLGLDVFCGDQVHRFLPLAAVSLHDDEIAVSSALTLLEEAELAFYRVRAGTLSALRGAELEQDGARVGRLRDLVVGERGALEAVLVDVDGDVERVDPPRGLTVRAA
jgi:uncharacterized protein YrrD